MHGMQEVGGSIPPGSTIVINAILPKRSRGTERGLSNIVSFDKVHMIKVVHSPCDNPPHKASLFQNRPVSALTSVAIKRRAVLIFRFLDPSVVLQLWQGIFVFGV